MGIANQGICSRRVQACYKRQRKWPLINLKLKGTVRFKEYVAGKTLDVNFNSSLPIAKYTIVRHTQQIWLEQIKSKPLIRRQNGEHAFGSSRNGDLNVFYFC